MNWKGNYAEWVLANASESNLISIIVFAPIILGFIIGCLLGSPAAGIYCAFKYVARRGIS